MEYFCFAVELLRAQEVSGAVITHADAASYLCGLLTDSGEERCVSLSADDNRVHIANLHKIKGLQAPIVILADPCTDDHAPNLRMTHDPDRTECRIFSLKKGNTTAAETDMFPSDFECILIIGDRVKENGEPYEGSPWQAFLPYAEGAVAACIPENPMVIDVPEEIADGEAMYE